MRWALREKTHAVTLAATTLVALLLVTSAASAQVVLALPQVDAPPIGDPRLELLPGVPIHLKNFNVFGTDVTGKSVKLTMRFPPRVNGQTQSDGDKHADMFVLFFADTGQQVPFPQRPIVEAVPLPLTGNILKAREFSAIWELHAVLVDPFYDPNACGFPLGDPAREACIDSSEKVETSSPLVRQIIQTNIFLNCPIVPQGTTIDAVGPGGPVPNEPRVMEAFFEGQIVNFVPYDIEDGGFNPQILFIFKDESGNILTNPDLNPAILNPPHIVSSKAPGEPFYSSIWEVWAVTVPTGTDVTTITAASQITRNGIDQFTIADTGIRLNCPVVAIDGRPFPFEDAFALLRALIHPNGVFNPNNRTPIGIPQAEFTPSRTFMITEVNPGGVPLEPAASVAADFPRISPDGPVGSDKGNVIPVILQDPFQVNPADLSAGINFSGPNTNGPRHRILQAELDDGLAMNPPQLPAAIETNVASLIGAGVLDPIWAPGGRPYQERLGQLVGRAIFEMVWRKKDGGNQKDVTSCLACHSQPHSGGAARGLYSLRRDSDRGGNVNPGSMWGGGPAELLRAQMILAGASSCNPAGGQLIVGSVPPAFTPTPAGCITFAHGTTGTIADLRGVTNGAFNTHMGMQSVEFVVGQSARVQAGTGGLTGAEVCGFVKGHVLTLAEAANCDLDRDGITSELTVGETTAVTAFLASLPAPRQANDDIITTLLGVTPQSVQEGRRLFRLAIANKGGTGCAACHTAFHPLTGTTPTTLQITNPENLLTTVPIQISHHLADQADVNEKLATTLGEPGLRLWGDFKLHKMGSIMRNGNPSRDVMKTAELWDAGSVFPYGRDGRYPGDRLRDVILAHEGGTLTLIRVRNGVQIPENTLPDAPPGSTTMVTITIQNATDSEWVGNAANPIRMVLTGQLTNGLTNPRLVDGPNLVPPDPAPVGSQLQGSFWRITESIPAGGMPITKTLTVSNPKGLPLNFDLTIQDHDGYSEAVASARAFIGLPATSQGDIINFLRAQLIGGKVGEGSGLVPPPPMTP